MDNVHSSHGLALGMLAQGVANHVLHEDLEPIARVLVDDARDTLGTTSASEPTDGGLGDPQVAIIQYQVIPFGEYLSASLVSCLSESIAFSTMSCHVECAGVVHQVT